MRVPMIRLAPHRLAQERAWTRDASMTGAGKASGFAIRREGAMMSRMTLKMKLGVGFGTLVVILAVMGVVGYRAVTQLVNISAEVDQFMLNKDLASGSGWRD